MTPGTDGYAAGWEAYHMDSEAPPNGSPKFLSGWWAAFALHERNAEVALGLDCVEDVEEL